MSFPTGGGPPSTRSVNPLKACCRGSYPPPIEWLRMASALHLPHLISTAAVLLLWWLSGFLRRIGYRSRRAHAWTVNDSSGRSSSLVGFTRSHGDLREAGPRQNGLLSNLVPLLRLHACFARFGALSGNSRAPRGRLLKAPNRLLGLRPPYTSSRALRKAFHGLGMACYAPYSHHMPPLRAQPRLGHKGDLACFRLFCLSTKEAHYKPHYHYQIFVMRSPRDPSDFT